MEVLEERENLYDDQQGEVHMGTNVKLARLMKNVQQKQLAYHLGLKKHEIIELEKSPVIEKEVVEEIANFLQVPVEFIMNHKVEETMRNYNMVETQNQTNNGAESSSDTIIQGNEVRQDLNGIPLNEYKDLFNQLTDSKVELALSKNENQLLKNRIAELEQKIKEIEERK